MNSANTDLPPAIYNAPQGQEIEATLEESPKIQQQQQSFPRKIQARLCKQFFDRYWTEICIKSQNKGENALNLNELGFVSVFNIFFKYHVSSRESKMKKLNIPFVVKKSSFNTPF